MADYGFSLSIPGFNALRNEPGVLDDLLRRGEAVARSAGEGYRAEVSSGPTRARVTVYPDTARAKRDEAAHNNLLRAMDSAR